MSHKYRKLPWIVFLDLKHQSLNPKLQTELVIDRRPETRSTNWSGLESEGLRSGRWRKRVPRDSRDYRGLRSEYPRMTLSSELPVRPRSVTFQDIPLWSL